MGIIYKVVKWCKTYYIHKIIIYMLQFIRQHKWRQSHACIIISPFMLMKEIVLSPSGTCLA